MSKPANKKLIGVFVLGATALLVVALVIFGSGKIFTKTVPIIFFFEGSVKGLDIGAPVVIRGVKIGSVTNVELQMNLKDLSFQIPVLAEFDPEKIMRLGGIQYAAGERAAGLKKLIDKGLRAQLQMQSIVTGQLMINLDFLPNTPIRLVGENTKYLEIPTVPTSIEELAQKLEKLPIEHIFEKLTTSLEGIEKLVNSPEVQGSTKALSQGIDDLRRLIRNIDQEIKPVAASVQDTLKESRGLIHSADKFVQNADGFVQNVDRQVQPLASKVGGTLDETKKLVEEVHGEVAPISSRLKETLEEARAAIGQAQKTLQAAESNFAAGSEFYHEVNEALEGLDEASRSIYLLTDYLQRHPDSVIWGKGTGGKK